MTNGWLAAVFLPVSLYAQTIVGAGYLAPAPVNAAPGQILTLFVDGVSVTAAVRAPAGPLPNTLAGVSVTFRQITDRTVPILEVRPISTCPNLSQLTQVSCATLAAVTEIGRAHV